MTQLAKTVARLNHLAAKPLTDLNALLNQSSLSSFRRLASSVVTPLTAQQLASLRIPMPRFAPPIDFSGIVQAAARASTVSQARLVPDMSSAWIEPLRQYARISNNLATQIGAAIPASTLAAITRSLKRSAELYRENLRLTALPSNLHAIEGLTSDTVLDFTLEHGISLYLVAPARVAQSLLRTGDRRAARRILGDQREAILSQCGTTLALCDAQETTGVRRALEQSIAAMGHDLYYPAQATAAAVLDRLVSQIAGTPSTSSLGTAAKRRPGESAEDFRARLRELNQWEGYIAAALWTAFAHYFRSKGDRVPSSFSRHATAHALGGRQYNRRSAVQGIMAATSAVAYLNGLT